ncbi:SRPBCC domain-containing protein [Poritiphilus flavus]|uniref:SRPBCC domain-containing protein n=1 Tax=Poritiphilus flavus TaxID=2697053 RepID=A0A6L9EF08_9FLAO|nr:SRPBCC domain-containing protein [Poritiphilus flavus]NAS13316.1 SRPBCC domain-containing protein [Poritiphilus flavus]
MSDFISNGRAVTTRNIFSRETVVRIDILADRGILWALLTNGSDLPRWNSTVISLEGDIRKGEKIRLRSTLDPKRVFKLKVTEFEPESAMIWGAAMGKRVFKLKTLGNGTTNFFMSEKIGGPLFPLFSGMIPPFDESFEQFAKDLKKESELIQNAN